MVSLLITAEKMLKRLAAEKIITGIIFDTTNGGMRTGWVKRR